MLDRRSLTGHIAALLAVWCISWSATTAEAQESDPRVTAAAAPVDSVADLSQATWKLAGQDRLAELWGKVSTLSEKDNSLPLASLRHDIELLEAHRRYQEHRARIVYGRKMAKVRQALKNEKLRDALTAAVQAAEVADRSELVLDDADVKRLVQRAEQDAAKHEQANEWLKAAALYRGLDLLYENQNRYEEAMHRVGRRLALLRLYAPEKLNELYRKAAEEEGDDAPEMWDGEEDDWRAKQDGISIRMLNESIALGAQRHVEGASYRQLLVGGVDYLIDLFKTDGIAKTFPALADANKTRLFEQYLSELRADLVAGRDEMDYGDARRLLDRLIARNNNTVGLPESVVIHEFGDGAMNELDEFSIVIWPNLKARFERTTQGRFSGVGIQISMVDRQLTVVTPLEDTPAHAAGIRSGEQIVTIDGKSTIGISLDQAVDAITGPEGTEVALGIKNPKTAKVRNVTLVRSQIKIVSVKGWSRAPAGGWDYYIDREARVGYVRMTAFGPNTVDELDEAVHGMIDGDGLNGLILDLRYNPGGRLDTAVDVCNRFLDRGTIVSTTQKTLLGQRWSQSADGADTYPAFPVIVLINKGSASASEIVSGALQDHGRALIVGERSFGKGSVQNLYPIGGDAAYLKLTTQYYMLPGGRIIHRRPDAERWGVEPDLHVKMTDRQVADVLRARTVLDVLRDEANGEVDPDTILNLGNDEELDEEDAPGPLVRSVDEILARGMDPQLETSVILMRARILGDEAARAAKAAVERPRDSE